MSNEHSQHHDPKTVHRAEPFAAAFASFADWIAIWSGRLAAIALVLICLLVNTEIFARNVLNHSTMISDEMCGYLNAAVVMFGLAYTMHQRGFVRVDTVHRLLSGAAKRIADWFTVLMSLLYLCVLLYCVTDYMLYSFNHNLRSEEITETPLFIPESFVVFGIAFLIIYLVKIVVERCRDVP